MRSPAPVTVIGSGAVGLAVALALARDGWTVTLVGDTGGAASASAAGMIAPASEAVLDGVSASTAAGWLAARHLWRARAARLGVALDPAGASHLDDPEVLDAREQSASRLGFATERRGDGVLFLADDAVLDPASALDALAHGVAEAKVVVRSGRAQVRDGRISLDGAPLKGEVVVAAGWGSAALAGAAPELSALRPIKGQLLRLPGAGEGPTLRGPHVYLAPHPGGWTAGATMEPGRDDLAPDPAALARLRASAIALRPELAGAMAAPAVGVRAAMDDGAPLVGRSRSGVWLATGMRRNGWLLAPLVAEGVAAYLAGRDPDPALAGQARAWDPARIIPQGEA